MRKTNDCELHVCLGFWNSKRKSTRRRYHICLCLCLLSCHLLSASCCSASYLPPSLTTLFSWSYSSSSPLSLSRKANQATNQSTSQPIHHPSTRTNTDTNPSGDSGHHRRQAATLVSGCKLLVPPRGSRTYVYMAADITTSLIGTG